MRVGLVQLTSGDDPAANLPVTMDFVNSAADEGAEVVMTPEVTNCVSASRERQAEVLRTEEQDETLPALAGLAKERGIWIVIGSLALKGGGDGRFVNRSFVLSPEGEITARYDKIHMFDVAISESERYEESRNYAPGSRAVCNEVAGTTFGLTICYDVRFPHLYRALAQAGAKVLTVPAAFSPVTGAAHWEVLLRARAIETGAFVLAPAQCGTHAAATGKARRTHGHSLAIGPWGDVLADGGDLPGAVLVDLDVGSVEDARRRVPSLTHDRAFEGP